VLVTHIDSHTSSTAREESNFIAAHQYYHHHKFAITFRNSAIFISPQLSLQPQDRQQHQILPSSHTQDHHQFSNGNFQTAKAREKLFQQNLVKTLSTTILSCVTD